MKDRAMIIADDLHKNFGSTPVLRGLDLDVPAGTIIAMLGPNGAGKTTAVRILTTLTRPDSGRATVAGIDVTARPADVRRQIGVAGQYASLDELLTVIWSVAILLVCFPLGVWLYQRRTV